MEINWNEFWKRFDNVLNVRWLDQDWENQKQLIQDLYPFSVNWTGLWNEFENWLVLMTDDDTFNYDIEWGVQKDKIQSLISEYKVNKYCL